MEIKLLQNRHIGALSSRILEVFFRQFHAVFVLHKETRISSLRCVFRSFFSCLGSYLLRLGLLFLQSMRSSTSNIKQTMHPIILKDDGRWIVYSTELLVLNVFVAYLNPGWGFESRGKLALLHGGICLGDFSCIPRCDGMFPCCHTLPESLCFDFRLMQTKFPFLSFCGHI